MEKTISAGGSPQNSLQGPREPVQEPTIPCDDGAISPASRKIIEQCTITITPTQNKEIRSFITRPPSSGLETTGFQFAKPNLAGRAFTTRSQPNAYSKQAETVDSRLPLESAKISNVPEKPSLEQKIPPNDERACSITSSANSGRHSLSPNNGDAGLSNPARAKTQPCVQDRSSTSSENPLPSRTEDTKSSQPVGVLHNRSQNAPAKAPPRSETGIVRMRNGADKAPLNGGNPPLKAKSPLLSPSVRVSKGPKHNIKNGPAPVARDHSSLSSHSQPSEEDLFYLLIHKLKKREETEVAATALREQLYAQIQDFKSTNSKLREQLKDVEQRCNKQETEKLAQKSIIERWKLKLNKLGNLMSSIGGDQEIIKKEGEHIRKEQASLNAEKQEIYNEMRILSDNTDGIGKKLGQHKAQLSGIHCEFKSLEQSLLSAKDKIADRESALGHERNRVAILEGFIRNQSNKIQKQSVAIHKSQLETVSKLGSICEYIDDSEENTHIALKTEVIPAIHACREAVGSLSKKESLERSHLVPIESSVEALSTRLETYIKSTIKEVRESTNLQNSNVEDIVSQLSGLHAEFQHNTQLCSQLAQMKEANRILRENLTRTEADLRSITEELNSSKSQEASLKRHIEGLESKLSSLQAQLAEASCYEVDANELSEMQTKLEASSSALNEAKEEVKANEGAMCEMAGELNEARKKLDTAEIEISRLESDKKTIEEASRGAEQRIRQELTRASLMSKDQNRAWFEQEKHKLEREKAAVEKQVTALENQIELMKSNLVRASDANQGLVVAANERENGIEGLKEAHLKELSEHEAETKRLRESEETLRKDNDSTQAKLVKVLDENETMNKELKDMRTTSDQLQHSLGAMESEVSSKEVKLATLQDELEDARNDAEQVADLRLELAQYLQEIACLQEQLDLAVKREEKVAHDIEQKEAANETTANLEDKVSVQERKICELQDELKEAEKWSTEIKQLLQAYGLPDENVSLVGSMKVLKNQLEGYRDKSHAEIAPEKPGTKSSRGGRRKRKRTVSTTPRGEKSSVPIQEHQAAEPVFRTNSVVNTPSPHETSVKNFSPKKKQTKPLSRIRPFSKIEWEPVAQSGSPVCLIPQPPGDPLVNAEAEVGRSPQTQSSPTTLRGRPGIETTAISKGELKEGDTLNCLENSRKGKHARTQDRLDDGEGAKSGKLRFENSKRRCIEDEVNGIYPNRNPSSHSREGTMIQQGRTYSSKTGYAHKEVDSNNSHQRGEANTNAQKGPLKGILKDTTLPAKPARSPVEARTPSLNREAKRTSLPSAVAPRRQSRVSSRFFDPQISPSPTLSVVSNNRETWTVKQSVDTFITRSRERNKRKRKGDLYDKQFNQ